MCLPFSGGGGAPDLQGHCSSKLQKLEVAESAQRQWKPQLEQLAAGIALATARRDTEERAEASVGAKVDTLKKDVTLVKAETRLEVAGELAELKGEVSRMEERALEAESRAEVRLGRKWLSSEERRRRRGGQWRQSLRPNRKWHQLSHLFVPQRCKPRRK